MAQKVQTKNKITITSSGIQRILEELRLLRQEVRLLLPQEDLEDYAHPERIMRSYQKAIKQYCILDNKFRVCPRLPR